MHRRVASLSSECALTTAQQGIISWLSAPEHNYIAIVHPIFRSLTSMRGRCFHLCALPIRVNAFPIQLRIAYLAPVQSATPLFFSGGILQLKISNAVYSHIVMHDRTMSSSECFNFCKSNQFTIIKFVC